MIIYELVRELDELEIELNDSKMKLFLDDTHEYLEEGISMISKVNSGAADVGNSVKNFKEYIIGIKKEITLIGPGKVFRFLERVESRIQNSRVFGADSDLLQATKRFSDSYERYISAYDFESALRLMSSAEQFRGLIESACALISAIKKSLYLKQDIPEGNMAMELLLVAPISHKDFVEKASAVENLYEESCRLLDVSTSEYPLEIRRIEVGSFFTNVFGEARVISFITSAIESAVSYLHRNFTRDGKIRSIPRNVEVVVSLLDLSERLQKIGIDSSEINKNLTESALKLSNELNRLLQGEPTVVVNGRRYSVGPETEEYLLRESKMLFLTSGTPLKADDDSSPSKDDAQ